MRYIDANKLQEVFKELHGGKRSLLIDTEPTADVRENVRGEWEDAVVGTSTGYTYHEKRCSICGHSEVLPMNFCPNCGADMRGE